MRHQVAAWVFVWSAGLACGIVQRSYSQEPEAVTPPNVEALQQSWPSLSPENFVADVMKLAPQRPKWDAAVAQQFNDAFIEEATRRLTQTDAATTADYQSLDKLVAWAHTKLSAEQKQSLREQLLGRAGAVAELGFDELVSRYRAQRTLGAPPEAQRQLACDWIAGRELSLLPIDQLEWCAVTTSRVPNTPGLPNQSLAVEWTGSIRPPRDGQYKFSGSANRIDLESVHFWARSAMQVSVDGQLVLDTTKPDDPPRPVQLSAERPSEIRVQFTHEHRGNRLERQHPPIAMLYWEGENVERQLVPAAALAPPAGQGQGPGLWGEYQAAQGKDKEGNELPPLKAEGIDPQIDFAWTLGDNFLLRDKAPSQRIAAELVTRYTQADYLAGLLEPLKKANQFPADDWPWAYVAELLSAAQRGQILQALAGNAELLGQVDLARIRRTFELFRPGAAVESVDLLGRWAQARPSAEAALTTHFYDHNRFRYLVLADYLTFEYPPGRARLEEKYLETAEGGCVLDAAYILSYCYALADQQDAWIAKLDAKLNNESISGDARVNWLLARAQAEEIRGSVGQRLTKFPERITAGWGWLDEASLIAASEPLKLRVLREKLARLVSQDRRGAVGQLLAESESRFNSPESQAALAEWKKAAEQLAKQFDAMQAAQVKQAQAAHLRELTRRMKSAEKSEDDAAVARYQQKLEALTPPPPAP